MMEDYKQQNPSSLTRMVGVEPREEVGLSKTLFSVGIAIAIYLVMTAYVLSRPLPWVLDNCLLDDSFYYLNTARNFATGWGSTFDRINTTNGYHPAWFLIVSAIYFTGFDGDTAVYVLIALQALLYCGSFCFLILTMRELGINALIATVITAIYGVCLVPVHGWNLLETGMNGLLSALALFTLLLWERGRLQHGWVAGVFIGFSVLARTDHIFFPMLLLVWTISNSWGKEAKPYHLSKIMNVLLPAFFIVGGYLLLNFTTTGYVQQVSGRVKMAGPHFSDILTAGSLFPNTIRDFWKVGLWFSGCIVARDLTKREFNSLTAYSCMGISLWVYYHLCFPIRYSETAYYYVPLYHIAVIATGFLTTMVYRSVKDRILKKLVKYCFVSVFLILLLFRASILLDYNRRPPSELARIHEVAGKLQDFVDPCGRGAAWSSGVLGYFSGLRLTNLDGLVNSHFYLDQYLSKGREIEYIRTQKFDILVDIPECFSPKGRFAGVLNEYEPVWKDYMWILKRKNLSYKRR